MARGGTNFVLVGLRGGLPRMPLTVHTLDHHIHKLLVRLLGFELVLSYGRGDCAWENHQPHDHGCAILNLPQTKWHGIRVSNGPLATPMPHRGRVRQATMSIVDWLSTTIGAVKRPCAPISLIVVCLCRVSASSIPGCRPTLAGFARLLQMLHHNCICQERMALIAS